MSNRNAWFKPNPRFSDGKNATIKTLIEKDEELIYQNSLPHESGDADFLFDRATFHSGAFAGKDEMIAIQIEPASKAPLAVYLDFNNMDKQPAGQKIQIGHIYAVLDHKTRRPVRYAAEKVVADLIFQLSITRIVDTDGCLMPGLTEEERSGDEDDEENASE